ncbi:MAG: prolipoprotein diacylglyceryl transferase [Muribaculaceae bacterium]|nr:prolipoprotein diacylglyceryl transferase [Muribaculaceae bacterium]
MLNYIVWDFNPIIFDSFITLRWYSLMFLIGFLIGYKIIEKIFKHEGAQEKWLGSLLLWVMVGTAVGARLGHVIFYEWEYYSQHPIEILYTWEGGLASHGGAIGVLLAVWGFSKFTAKRNIIWTLDRLVVAVALVAGLIRMGNLFNSEIFGHATDLPWGFMFIRSREWHALYEGQACHPTQIYEALCYFALFALLMIMYWKRNAQERPGLLFGTFLIGVFTARFLIEFIKNDQSAFEASMTLNMGQWLSIPFIIAGIAFIIYALKHNAIKIDYPDRFADSKK